MSDVSDSEPFPRIDVPVRDNLTIRESTLAKRQDNDQKNRPGRVTDRLATGPSSVDSPLSGCGPSRQDTQKKDRRGEQSQSQIEELAAVSANRVSAQLDLDTEPQNMRGESPGRNQHA
jgi:hypothetical protein